MTSTRKNWAGNLTFAAARFAAPDGVDEIRRVIAGSERVHVVGAGHSFSRIADTTGTLLSLANMPALLEVGQGSVRVGAGMRLAELADRLQARGLALPTMPSLPHITIAGAVASATHGSGTGIGSLAGLVESVEIVTAAGERLTIGRDDPRFGGSVVALGGLGVVTALRLAVRPTFDVEQRVFQDVPLDALADRFDDVLGCAYSVSAFTQWNGTAEVWVKRRVDGPPADLAWTGGRAATEPRHPVPGQPALHCTQQLGVPGPWHERLPHFRADFTPSVGEELQSEFFVARPDAPAALRALEALRDDIRPILLTTEIRTIAADRQWLSMTEGRDSVAFHFTWVQDTPAVLAVVARIEQALAPWSARPHWAKLFTLDGRRLRERYPHWGRFAALLRELDPKGTFHNDELDRLFPREA